MRQKFFRLEAIAQDAELEEFSKSELELLGNELLTGCQKAQKEYEIMTKEGVKKPTEDGKRKQVQKKCLELLCGMLFCRTCSLLACGFSLCYVVEKSCTEIIFLVTL